MWPSGHKLSMVSGSRKMKCALWTVLLANSFCLANSPQWYGKELLSCGCFSGLCRSTQPLWPAREPGDSSTMIRNKLKKYERGDVLRAGGGYLEMSCGKRPTSAGTAFAALWRSLWAHWRRKNLNGTRHLGSWRWSRFSTPRCNAWPRWCSTKGYKPTLGWTPRLPARPYKPVQIQPRGKGIGFLKVQIVRSCGTWWRAGSWWSLWRSTNAVLALFVCTKYVMWLPNSAMFL